VARERECLAQGLPSERDELLDEPAERGGGAVALVVAGHADEGRVDSGRRPEGLRRERAEDFHLREKLGHHGKRPVRVGSRSRPQAIGDFLLHGEDELVDAEDQQFDDQRVRDVVREVRDELSRTRNAWRCGYRAYEVNVDLVLRRERISLDEREPFVIREPLAEELRQVAINLYRDLFHTAGQQFLRQRPRARPHLDDQVPRRQVRRVGDQPDQILIDHEILPEPVPRLRVRAGEEGLDLGLGLGHFRARLYPHFARPAAGGAVCRIVPMKRMICSAALVALLIGCKHDREPTVLTPSASEETRQMDRPSYTVTVQSQAADLETLVQNVQKAKTPQAEADALRRLRKYESDNGLTYTVSTFRTYDNLAIDDPSVRSDPVRAEVTIFRGRDTVRTFNFITKDNRNLAIMGE
jgi:hypothetical protein